jgi:hypothetical protein
MAIGEPVTSKPRSKNAYAPLKIANPAPIAKEKLSLFVGSVTETAVIVGDAFAALGEAVGGVYVALKVGEAGILNVPHAGEHATPPAVNDQETPALAASFVTVAFTGTAGPPAVCAPNLFVMFTTIGWFIVKLKLSFFVVSVTDVAVIVGDAFAPAGALVGGV